MGRPREELIGKSDYDLFPKEQAAMFWERDNYTFKSGQTDVNEEQITWHGKLHTISTKKSVFADSLTGKKFISGTIRDITERKKADEALRESERKFRSYIDNAPDGVLVIDKQGKCLEANKAASRISGYSRQELLEKSIPDTLAAESKEAGVRHFEQVLRNGHATGEFACVRKDGNKCYWSVDSVKISESRLIGFIKDITKRKQDEHLQQHHRCYSCT